MYDNLIALKLENYMKSTHIIAFTLLLFSNTIYAGSEILTVHSFNELQALVEQQDRKSLSQTLVVMDDDDTISTMSCPNLDDPDTCQYLGGPAWGSWQGSLLGTQSHYLVAKDVNQIFAIAGLLLAINDMDYAEDAIPNVLNKLTASGVKLLGLTARSPTDVSATEQQFSNLAVQINGSTKKDFLSFMNAHALKNKHNKLASLAGPFIPKECGATRGVSYQQGVMYVAGQNKGLMLQCLLNKVESSAIKNIYFIDDTLKNVVDVNNAFKDNKNYNVKSLHYTFLQQKKDNLTQGKNAKIFQKNAHVRWESIKETLKEQLQKPAVVD